MKNVNTRKNLLLKSMLSMVIVAMVLMTVTNVAVLTASALSPDSIPYGECSDEVWILERRLDELNYMPTEPDGEFDEYTVRAIKDFQYLSNLESTGEPNTETLRLLFSGNAIPREDYARIK